jgi:hypothetical protein
MASKGTQRLSHSWVPLQINEKNQLIDKFIYMLLYILNTQYAIYLHVHIQITYISQGF